MKDLSLENIKNTLEKFGLEVDIESKSNQVFALLHLEEREFPLFVRLITESKLIQLIAFLPCQPKEEATADVARLLHLFNKELDIPGFGLDESSGAIFFRTLFPAPDNQLNEKTLQDYLNTTKTACQQFIQPIEAVALAAVTFENLLAKAKEKSGA